ncbi:unnamed protein product [Calypogeia fissa]
MDQTEMVLAAYGEERELRDDLVRMCVDKPSGVVDNTTKMMVVDAPTSPGVWRRVVKETNSCCWELYPLNVAESIFSAFCGGGNFVEWFDCTAHARKRKRDSDECTFCSCCTASTHRVDFETMKEVELSTGIEIDVSIVQANISAINYTPIEEPIETGVWWKDDSGNWHCYAEKAVNNIRTAWRRREHFVTLKKLVTRRFPRGVKYIINLTDMEQLNPISGMKRPIKIISNASMPPEVSSSGGGGNLTIFSLGMDLLRGSLQRLLSVGFIDSMVSKMVLAPHEILAIEPSKHLKDDDRHPLYRKFRLAYETTVRRVPGCCGQLMRLRSHTRESEVDKEETLSNGAASSVEPKPIFQHAFYLAPAGEVDKILETGLQGCRQSKESFALSTNYYDLHNSKTGESRLLLFLIVVPKRPKGSGAGIGNAIPVASVDHQLPIAVLTLRNHTHIEPELPNLDSGQSGATDSNPFDCANHNDSCLQVLRSTTAGLDSVEITTTADISIRQRPILPSKSKEDLFLLFKLYCPERERLLYVGGLVVRIGGRPSEILEWLREIAGFAPDAEIQLFTENSSKRIDLNLTYRESELEDGGVVVYNKILTGKERRSYRCPDVPTFKEHVRNRQTIHFRKVSSPTVDEFCLELSNQDTHSDVIERVAQHLGLEDGSRVMLYLNDCFLQLPKPLPVDSSSSSTLLGNAYKNTASILYFKILDLEPPQLDGSKTLSIAFYGGKGEKLSVHEVELPKRSAVRDAVEKLRGKVKELCNPADAEMRLFEVRCNRISKIHPPNERIGHVCDAEEWSCKNSLRAMEIPEEDRDVGPNDRLIHVRHFHCPQHSRKCDFFGEPFLMVVREHETLTQVKERIKEKVKTPEEEFLQCKFALLSAGRREYLNANDVVASQMEKFSLGFYDPLLYYLGLEHSDSSKSSKHSEDVLDSTRRLKRRLKHVDGNHAGERASSRLEITPKSSQAKLDSMSPTPNSTYTNQSTDPEKGDILQNLQAPRPGQCENTQPMMKRSVDIESPDHRKDSDLSALDDKLGMALAVVQEHFPNQGSSDKCTSPVRRLSVSQAAAPDRDTSHITVPDPEFHNFDSFRTEKDIIPGQVWAIYDNHDGMPRYYGLITDVCHSPFKVELSWLEPHRKKRWWVETTGLSITCGEYEISRVSEIERHIGVFSHLVLQKAVQVRGMIQVYPRKGEVWAIFSNWDVLHMLGPKPILTPNGTFNQSYEYHIWHMLDDYSAENGVPAVRLVKTKGFKTVFHPQEGPHGIKTYLPKDLKKFSHSIPAEKMDSHLRSLPAGAVELDPASLPVELAVVDGPIATGEPFGYCSG